MNRIKTVFRLTPRGPIALFPEVPADEDGFYCGAYRRTAGVSENLPADHDQTLTSSTPAELTQLPIGLEPKRHTDAHQLYEELLDLGYALQVLHAVDVKAARLIRADKLKRLLN